MGRTSIRMYSLGYEMSKQYFESHTDVEIGDLVTYTDATGGKSAGYIQKIFEQTGSKGHKDHLAEIQNYHTKKIAYSDLKNVQSVARKHDTPLPTTKATPKTATQQRTASSTASAEATSATKTADHHLKESAQKVQEQVNAKSSPLKVDFAPGDIVRYRVGQNFTAGVVLEIVYSIIHDESGNFHGATKENPMAKLENLWTKHITYHHLNVLEHVKSARDVTPGRFAEHEYAVYDKHYH
jgi:hypothetical protein